jgi:molecular chaperone GrpE
MTKKAKTKFDENDIDNVSGEEAASEAMDFEPETEQQDTASEPEEDNSSQTEELTQKLNAAEETNRELQDKYLRLSAEFDNYRKRTLKEKMELTKQANGDLLKDILSVIDDFERGMKTMQASQDLKGLQDGIVLIYNKFIEFVRQNGVKEIDAREKDFDIDFHEALTKIPAPSEDLKGKVIDVVEKGYLLNDKVLRYAKVVVGE